MNRKLNCAISCGGRSYWEEINLQSNSDFSMAELIRNRLSVAKGKIEKNRRLFLYET